MTSSEKLALVGVSIMAVFALIAMHTLFARRVLAPNPGRFSPQKTFFQLVLCLNPLVVVLTLFAIRTGAYSALTERIAAVVYVVLFFNAVAYAYFHVFNLSETGRRIRILLILRDRKHVSADMIERDYSPEAMVQSRLVRLMQMGELDRLPNGNYVIGRGSLLAVARVLSVVARAMVGSRRAR